MPWWTSGYDPEALDENGRPLTFAYRVTVTEGYSEDRPVHVTYEAICPVCGSREESVHHTTRPDDFPRELSGVCGPSLAHGQYQPYTVRLIVARFWNYLPAEPRRLKGSAAKAAMASPAPPPPRKTAASRLPHAALDDRLRRSRSSTIQTALALGYSDTAPPPVPRRDPAILGTIAADIPKRTSPAPTTRTTPARARTRTQPHQTARKPGTYSTDPTQPPSTERLAPLSAPSTRVCRAPLRVCLPVWYPIVQVGHPMESAAYTVLGVPASAVQPGMSD